MSLYCASHKRRLKNFGSAEGEAISGGNGKKLYQSQLNFTHELIVRNITSAPIKAGMKLVRQWLNAASNHFDVPGQRVGELIPLVGTPEVKILEELSAVYIYVHEHTHMSDKEIRYALANALRGCIPHLYEKRPASSGKSYYRIRIKLSPTEKDTLGDFILKEWGILFENLRTHYRADEQQHTTLKHQLAEEL
jgi:hypothetical protein